jgi:hypothetical protein
MDYSREYTARLKTGEFYTPPLYAELAVKYMREVLPSMEDYLFWDMAAGHGNLLDALPENCEKYATTYEYDDIPILREKGYVAHRMDFLDGDWTRHLDLVAARDAGRLIVFTNPPYLELPADQYVSLRKKHKTINSVELFYQKILNDVQPLMLCGFNKLDIFQAPKSLYFRQTFQPFERIVKMFVTPSHGWGLKGEFPIVFNMFLT